VIAKRLWLLLGLLLTVGCTLIVGDYNKVQQEVNTETSTKVRSKVDLEAEARAADTAKAGP